MQSLSNKINNVFLIAIFIFVFHIGIVFGQSLPSLNSAEITASPATPSAGDTVDLTLASYSINLDSAKIVWYVDGVATKDGFGANTLTITTKGDGQTTSIRAVAQANDGTVVEATKDITPASIDLISEPTSYTPPFYKGRPLFINQGQARVVAVSSIVVDGKKVSPNQLVFKWSKNGVVSGSDSGIGRDSLLVVGSIPIRDIAVSVEVLDLSGNTVAASSKTVAVSDPKILFYEDNSLYGILFNEAINQGYYLGLREELDVTAKPFFFNFASDIDGKSSYRWFVNGNYIVPTGKENELILKQTDTSLKGTASISIDVSNTDKIFQYASDSFNVTFGQ